MRRAGPAFATGSGLGAEWPAVARASRTDRLRARLDAA